MLPLVSVIMPNYNSVCHLEEAVKSILTQTLHQIELIIVDDGSKDDSVKVLKNLMEKDTRIRLYTNKVNLNIGATLNIALSEARSEYVARMDADDISTPLRLEKQYEFLKTHPKIAAVGSDIVIIDENSKVLGVRRYEEHDRQMKKCLFRYSCFAHPAIMYRKKAILEVGGYNPAMSPTEDLDLWFRLGQTHSFANIPEPLLHYRVYANSTSNKKLKMLEYKVFRIRLNAALKLGYKPSLFDIIYNILQAGTVFLPANVRTWIYNFLRNNNII